MSCTETTSDLTMLRRMLLIPVSSVAATIQKSKCYLGKVPFVWTRLMISSRMKFISSSRRESNSMSTMMEGRLRHSKIRHCTNSGGRQSPSIRFFEWTVRWTFSGLVTETPGSILVKRRNKKRC